MIFGNLHANSEAPASGERFDSLLQHKGLVAERTISFKNIISAGYGRTLTHWFNAGALAASLLFMPLTAMSAQPLDVAATEATGQVSVADRITVVTVGSGPDVILIPGLASSRRVWASTVDRLQRTHRLHLVQVAGFAGAAAGPNGQGKVAEPVMEAIAQYIVQQQLTAPTIIGHSFGGEVALMLAARHPARVGSLVVVDALPFFSLLFDPTMTAERAVPGAVNFRDSLLNASPEQAAAMQAASVARLVKTPAARAAIVETALQSDRATVANAAYELMTTDLRPELGNIKAPVEVIYAYDSTMGIPTASTDAFYRAAYGNLAGVRLTRIDDSLHFIMLDQPQRFNAAVEKALAQGRTP